MKKKETTVTIENNKSEKSMSLLYHLNELRRRLFIIALVIVVGAAVALFFAKEIYYWLQIPLASALPDTSNFISLSPVEGWLVFFKVSIIASLFVTSPIWLYQFWAFIAPGLHKRERILLIILGVVSAALFVGGALMCYYLIMPHGFKYFVSILEQTGVSLMPQMSLYFSFMLRLMVAFGVVFQIPLVTLFLVRWDVVSLKTMRKARPFVIVISFTLAAFITPPDVFTQIALAIPFLILFEISLLIAWFLRRSN